MISLDQNHLFHYLETGAPISDVECVCMCGCGELCYLYVCMGVCVSITSTDAYYNGSANADFTLYFALLLFFRYIYTFSEYFSKWVEAVATHSKEAHQVASALYKVCII